MVRKKKVLQENVFNPIGEIIVGGPEQEIGSKMTENFVAVSTGTPVKQAMRELVKQAADNDNISVIYVVDADNRFVGTINLKDLIIARESTRLEDITERNCPYVYANELIDACMERLVESNEDSVPVLDNENRLVGVLLAQDITRLVDEAMGDDYAKLGGLTSEEDLQEPLKQSIRKRLPWLVILLGLGLLVSGVVGLFEQVVASLTVVICFQSLILGMAGNVGTQSLAVTVRVLMDSQLRDREKFSLVVKEAKVGLCNGLLLGAVSFVLVGLYLMAKGETAQMAFSVSVCTGIALVISMGLSSIFGTAVPLLFKQLNIDPAVASGPLITTINDLVAVVAYYGLAWLLLVQKM
ncbi:MAG: magnesium transporter [Oscillospiraceae bacterium]|nr:magnesium transporter [Oscillospiraceae bacterium]